uniref:Serine protease 54 n=1 Tax=Molossus molossus TaxID=27622 RepID=A0A7J8CAD4_MOLMO|nr:serine protease 54 [Molossus molossus]
MVSAAAVLGDGVTGMLLVLLCASHASASCGIQKVNVVEDSEEGLVSEKEFPWVVSLQNSHHTHLAFGSILSAFWILSIASAFQNRSYQCACHTCSQKRRAGTWQRVHALIAQARTHVVVIVFFELLCVSQILYN